jgi:membrane protein implicated in regulation of membrane protease activity
MTWAAFYLICFVVGLVFSLVSLLGGGSRSHLLPHMPHAHGAHAVGSVGVAAKGVGRANASPASPINFVTLTAFLAWFGGAGYLLTKYSNLWFFVGLGFSTLSGLIGATVIFLFLTRVLTSEDENLDPADFEMTGVLGRISVPIRAGGTGEMIYSQEGTRRSCGARADDATVIPKGSEVVVTRYERGIAYVKLWSELCGEERALSDTADLQSRNGGKL